MPISKDNQSEIFVRLPSETSLRENFLESAKISTQLLKDFDKISLILKQKKKEKFKLKLLMSEIKSLSDTIQFNDISWFDKKPEDQKPKSLQLKKEERIAKEKKDQLTLDLEEIERKLNSLKF